MSRIRSGNGELLHCPWLSRASSSDSVVSSERTAAQGLGRRERTKAAIAPLHARAADRRKDFAEQTSPAWSATTT
jgi:hypothetical protein